MAELNDDLAQVCRTLFVMLQLHEFWVIDEDEEDTLTLLQYAEDNGLTVTDEPLIGGLDHYLASVPVQEFEFRLSQEELDKTSTTILESVAAKIEKVYEDEMRPEPSQEVQEPPKALEPTPAEDEEDNPFYEAPRKAIVEPKAPPLPVLRTLNGSELQAFQIAMGLGLGKFTVEVLYEGDGKVHRLCNTEVDTLPPEYKA